MRASLAYTSARILLLARHAGTVCGLALVLELPVFSRRLTRESGQPPAVRDRRSAAGRAGG
jgi:hypothetical protein